MGRESNSRGSGSPIALIVGLPVHPRRLAPVLTVLHAHGMVEKADPCIPGYHYLFDQVAPYV